jgi:hypothetical protein
MRTSFMPEQQKTDSPDLPILFVTRVLRVLDWIRAIVQTSRGSGMRIFRVDLGQARRLSIACKPYSLNELAHCNTIQTLALCA